MALFGRRSRKDRADDLLDVAPEETRPQPADGVPGVDRPWDRASDGPFDLAEHPDTSTLINLGALRVPAVQGAQMRLDLDQASGQVVGCTMGLGASQIQLQAFAAPRTLGLWDELRPEIAKGLVDAGGAAEVVDGQLGKELRARMPGRAADGRVAFQPARFLGIDGPRWFMRVVVSGAAATDDDQLTPILRVVRSVVVSRGDEPRPPREVLELTPPAGVMEAAAQEAEARRLAEQQAAAAAAARETEALREQDATALTGIRVGGNGSTAPTQTDDPLAPRTARHRAPEPEQAPTAAPKPPTNPEFT